MLDSSATLAWVYGNETTESIRELFDAIADSGVVVPALWRLDVANSLTVAVRRGRIDADFRQAALTDLALLDITTEPYRGLYRCICLGRDANLPPHTVGQQGR